MPTTYREADADLRRILAELRADGHPDLAEADVTIHPRFAHGEDGEPALKDRGRRVIVKVKVNSYEARQQGLCDVTLTVDGAWWQGADDAARRADLDSALLRIQVVRGDTGEIKTDDANRPKLRRRVPDLFAEEFESILRKHGRASTGARQIADVLSRPAVQGEFKWG
jgi:hypothetical protein